LTQCRRHCPAWCQPWTLIGKRRHLGDELGPTSQATRVTVASPGDYRRRSSAAAAVKRNSSRLDPNTAMARDNSIQLDEMRRGSVAGEVVATSPIVTGCGLGVRSNSGYVLLPTRAD